MHNICAYLGCLPYRAPSFGQSCNCNDIAGTQRSYSSWATCSATVEGIAHAHADPATIVNGSVHAVWIESGRTLMLPLHKQGRMRRPSSGSGPSRQIRHCFSPVGVPGVGGVGGVAGRLCCGGVGERERERLRAGDGGGRSAHGRCMSGIAPGMGVAGDGDRSGDDDDVERGGGCGRRACRPTSYQSSFESMAVVACERGLECGSIPA
jgi:hypothetical protein